MAVSKRKEAPQSKSEKKAAHKRARIETVKPKASKKSLVEKEAETDSDPVIESDTTEHSGGDDGVSWPSDSEAGDAVEDERAPAKVKSQLKNGPAKSSETKEKQEKVNGAASTAAQNKDANSSKEAHAKQKVLVQERKAAKPNADVIARSKRIWEQLRNQATSKETKDTVRAKETKKGLINELCEILTGRAKDFVLKHDAGRVVQAALKYGNLEQRKAIARELKGDYRTLAESRYAKFAVGKILVRCDNEVRDMVVEEFYGHVRKMIKHPEAAWILDDVYRGAATPKQKARLLREWYGAEYALLKTGTAEQDYPDLAALLVAHPERKNPIMRYLFEMINQLVQKKTTGFTMLHDAMLQFYLNTAPGGEDATEFVELLKGDEEGDLLKNLAFTKSGARVVSLALANGNAKDRKNLLKVYKGVVKTMAADPNAHKVLLTALDVVDDTVLTSKTILGELFQSDETFDPAIMLTQHARTPFLYPFVHKLSSILSADDLALFDETRSIREKTSKKDPEIRRKELARYASAPLLALLQEHANFLLQDPFGCQTIAEVLLSADGDRSAVLEQLLIPATEHVNSEESGAELPTLYQGAAVGRMLKSLVQSGHFNPATKQVEMCEPPLGFADMLWPLVRDAAMVWLGGAQQFVVVGLMESEDFGHKVELKDLIKKHQSKLKKVVEQGKAAEVEAKSRPKVKKGAKKGAEGEEKAQIRPYKGAQILLESVAK